MRIPGTNLAIVRDGRRARRRANYAAAVLAVVTVGAVTWMFVPGLLAGDGGGLSIVVLCAVLAMTSLITAVREWRRDIAVRRRARHE